MSDHLLPALLFIAACSSSSTPAPATRTPIDAGADTEPFDAAPSDPTCEAESRTGSPSGSTTLKTAKGTRIVVRTPDGYDPLVGSPLLVVYAPSGANALDTEDFTGLTPPAKRAGMIIAYVDHLPPSESSFTEAATVPGRVQESWCIDAKRIYLTGHSDGATVTELITKRELVKPAAISASASGIKATNTGELTCAATAVPVMQIHGTKDALFPLARGYGKDVAAWWAKCNVCDATPSAPDDAGCVTYASCKEGAEVRYCEWAGAHPQWSSSLNAPMLEFFQRFSSR